MTHPKIRRKKLSENDLTARMQWLADMDKKATLLINTFPPNKDEIRKLAKEYSDEDMPTTAKRLLNIIEEE